jgi:toxin ParE1/3/4
MSAHSIDVRLSRSALQDIDDVLLYTQRTWGTRQRASYRAAIYRALGRLAQFPDSGRSRDDLFPGCRSLQVELHVIYYYQPENATIVVRRVLHQRQDASAAVSDPRG